MLQNKVIQSHQLLFLMGGFIFIFTATQVAQFTKPNHLFIPQMIALVFLCLGALAMGIKPAIHFNFRDA